jgi:hypothetical protein
LVIEDLVEVMGGKRRSEMDDIDLKDRTCSEAEEKRMKAKARSKLAKDKPWTVDVDVYLHSQTPGEHSVESYLQTDPSNDDLVFCNSHHPGFYVHFHLYDETGLGYRFPLPANKKDGVWSQLGTSCPSTGIWDVFDGNKTDVKDQGATLIAFNPNPSPAQGQFQYCLNVSIDGNPPYLPIDPGGNNMNGGTSRE